MDININFNEKLNQENEQDLNSIQDIDEDFSEVDSDENDLKSTIVYLILSFSEDYVFHRKHIEVFSDNKIKQKIKRIKSNNQIEGIKIYFFKIKLYLKEDEGEVTFNIRLNYFGKSLISTSEFNVKKYQQLFIYNEKYKYEYWYVAKEKRIDDFVNNKYKLSNFQKFLIFKNYLPINQIPFLLLETTEVISKSKIFDFEFVLNYFITLTDKQENFSELSWGFKDMFKSVLLNLKNKKKIMIRKYNNKEYRKVINIIENYDIGIGDKEFLLYYYLFILLYYQYHGPDKFNDIFNQIPLKSRAIKFVLQHKINFSNINSSNLQCIFEKVNRNKISFDNILSLSTDYNESIKFICRNKEYVLSGKKEILFNELPSPNENIDIEILIQYIEILREIKVDKTYFFKQFSQLIRKLNMKSYIKLISLKKITETYKDIQFTNSILKELRLSIHNTGKYFIENNKLENKDIITFIQEDSKFFPKDYEIQDDLALLIGYIDMDKVDNDFCDLFNKNHFNYEKLYKSNYLLFLDSLTLCIKNFKHFYILYFLFDIFANPHPGNYTIEALIKSLMNNSLDRKELTISDLSQIIGLLYKLISDNNNIYLTELIEATYLNFSEKEVDIIFIHILNQYGKELNYYIIDELIQTIKNISNEDVISYLNQFENKEIKISFLKKLNDRVVREDEVINEEISDNLKLFIQLFYMGYFNEDEENYKHITYIKNTQKVMYQLIEKLGNFNFSMKYLTILYRLNNIKIDEEKTMLMYRCFIMSFGNQFLMNKLYEVLVDKIYMCFDIFGKIEEIIQIFSYYFADEWDNIIQYYRNVRKKIIDLPINQFPDTKQIKYFDKFYAEAHEINQMKDSKFFLEIYHKVKIEDELNEYKSNEIEEKIQNEELNQNENKNKNSTQFFKAKDKFLNLKNLFNINTEKFLDLKLLEELISTMSNEEMVQEVNFLKKIFNVSEESSLNHIFKKLSLLKDRKETIDFLHKIILLFKNFKIKYDRIQKRFENAIEQLENNPTLNQLTRIDNILKRLNLNILSSDSKDAQAVIHQMFIKPELMNFILDKTINDIHQMGEFIDESEDVFIVLSDIDQLESCKSFTQELKKRCNQEEENEVKFLNQFIDLIQTSDFKDIGIKFENSSGKYNDFYDLYTYHLNSNELNKVHIKRIYQSSKFEINFVYPEYKCIVYYMNNKKLITKEFDEVLDLRDIALLRKKEQRIERSKEGMEENYIKISEDFAEIITDIQEILSLLECVTFKGYYKELNYTIELLHGKAYCYEKDSSLINNTSNNDYYKKSLKEIIFELKNIKELQDNHVQSIYISNPITRLIYGRQFNYLYEKIGSNANQNSINNPSYAFIINNVFINILKYVTNNNYKFSKKIIVRYNGEISLLKKMYIDVSFYLSELYSINTLSLKEIYINAHLLDETKTGIYSHICPLKDIEKNTIYCSLNLTGNFPIAQTVLYCNRDTSEEEIISFIYRCILCKDSVLFILIKPDYLSIQRKNLLIELLKKLYSPYPRQMQSNLLIVYSNENKMKEIAIEIEKLPYHKYFDYKIEDTVDDNNNNNKNNNNNNNNKNFKDSIVKTYNGSSSNNINNHKNSYPIQNKIYPNVEIYSSEFSGLGKSTLIKQKFETEFQNQNYQYVYFPIGGDFNKEEVVKRLLELTNRNIALHLDLYDTRKIDFLNEFLFSFLILKYYSKNENIFYYGNEMKIKIEIPNSFVNFKYVYPIFEFFKTVHIDLHHMPPLIVPNNILSNVQIVCNYLKNLDQINIHDIYINGISQFTTPQSIKAIPLSQKECSNLIYQNLNIKNPNYYQIESYINILAEQLKLFTNSIYLNTNQLNNIKTIKKNLDNIRYFFVKSLTLTTKHFVTSSFDNILKGQKITYSQQQKKIFDLEKENEQAIEILTNKEPFSINKIKPSMILINEDGQSISEIITCNHETDEYRLLKAIYNSDLMDESRGVLEYKKLKPEQFLVEVKKVLNLYNPIHENDTSGPKQLGGKILKPLNQIVKSYVFTADNFIKLILISLRLRTNIPVIMMGETGCGKTSLIRIVAELKNITMYTLNIHAGIEDKDIIEFINEKKLLKDNENQLNEEKEKTIWVFLDEINTCNSLGLITEIMLKRSCNGKTVKSNVKFIAACNPYRLDTRKREVIGLYDESKHLVRKLVYSVHPLPHSLLNFVFDFGTPEMEDIKRYISNMVHQFLKTIIFDYSILNKIKYIAERAIFDAQNFIKNNFEISSVSLREIRRWGILFEWFSKLLRNPYFSKIFEFSDDQIYLYSLNLSVYLCYYIRIFDKDKRSHFLQLMKNSFGSKFKFESFPKRFQYIIADAVELEKGIAKNRALLENLFAIFVCLNTKIPLFIIGKPGCSKSLSAQLIFKSMNGKDSSNEFFKYFPKVFTKSYQGSLTSNSKGVLKIFKKARKSLKEYNIENEIISTVYFDEMGLAEISQNNPLKVIHSQLEYDENNDKVSFIGISNWPLDASKMNRGIHLSIPEPDEEDLIETALAIAESFDIRLKQDYREYYTYLAYSYHEYKKEIQQNYSIFETSPEKENNYLKLKINNKSINIKEFHGSRDFYHLIKIVSKRFIEMKYTKDRKKIEDILKESIERNFGGLSYSISIFKQFLRKYIPNINESNKYNVMKCIADNIMDSKSRYLLIETKSSISHFLISLILEQLKKNYVFYYGSHFEEDISHDYYSAKVLNKIQVSMSQNNVMILKNLTGLYPSLYDLFNQNFRKVGESNYARIALGNSNTQNYLVNNDLRCVILLDRNEISKQDPPFINRFEKHVLTFEYLLNQKQIQLSNKIFKLINDLIGKGNRLLKIDLQHELVNCDLEEIQGIIYQLDMKNKYLTGGGTNSKNGNMIENHNNDHKWIMKLIKSENNTNEDIEDFIYEQIFEKIVPTLSKDILFYAKNSNFSHQYKNDFEKISKIYFKMEYQHRNLKCYLEKINTDRHIIFTFSNILDSVYSTENNINIIKNEKYKNLTKATTKTIFINQYESERAIDEVIYDYFTNNNYNLFIIHFDNQDFIHLCHINYLIENIEISLKEKNQYTSKIIILIVHLKRHITYNNNNNKIKNEIINEINETNKYEKIHNEYLISHLTQWKQFFIDDLNGKNINIQEIYEATAIELFMNKNLINLEEEFKKDLFHAFTLISYKIKINFSTIEKDEYVEKLCSYINNNKDLIANIQDLILKKIKNIKDNIIMKIFSNNNFEMNDIDFISIISKYLKSIYNEGLIRTLVQFEEYNILSTMFLNEKEGENENFKDIYQDYIDKFDNTFRGYSNFSQTVKIDLILGVSYPCIISIFNRINAYTNTLIGYYLENENKLRRNEYNQINDYLREKQFLENNLIIEFGKDYFETVFRNIEYNYEKHLTKFFKDYVIYYLSKSNKNFLNSSILEFFKALYKLFVSKNADNEDEQDELIFESIIKFILFIESYKDYLQPFIEFICTIDLCIPNFLNNFISILNLRFFKIPNEENISYVNGLFFNLYESFVYSIFNINLKFIDLSDEIFNNFLNQLTLFSHYLMKVTVELYLTLKQYYYLLNFIQINEVFVKFGISLKSNLQKYKEILKKENETYILPKYIDIYNINKKDNNNNIKGSNELLKEEIKFLEEKLSKNEKYSFIIVKLLNNKIKISNNDNYRLEILNILCSNNLFIIKAKLVFETIFNKFNICQMDENEKENKRNSNKKEDDCKNIVFLSEIKNKKDNPIIKYLNEINNICVDEVLISLFDGKFSKYFESKRSRTDIIWNQSFKIFKKCISHIEAENSRISKDNKVGILYCVSYIKYYCYHFSKTIHMEENIEEPIRKEIFDFLNTPSNFRKVIKLYILKLLNVIFIGNYKNFSDLIKQKEIFYNDFDFNEKVPCSLNYLFIQNNTFEEYKNLREIYILNKMENYTNHEEILKKLNNKNIIVFYDLIINKEISNLIRNFDEKSYNSFSKYIFKILNQLKLSPISKNILLSLYGYDSILNEIPKLLKLSTTTFEILLYSYKFAFICSLSNKESVYSKILTPNVMNYLKNIYIPGGEPNDSLLIESGDEINNYIMSGKDVGIYMCSCYAWYTVDNCGKPMISSKCGVCGQPIGGTNHSMVDRPGHVKIYKDEYRLNNDRGFVGTIKNYKMLGDLMKEVEEARSVQIKGYKKVKKDFFTKMNKNVRNINKITYRILSFIFYSCILCDEKLNYLKPENLKEFYYLDAEKNDQSILSIITDIWKILVEELLKRDIDNIQCFLNMIINEIAKLIIENNKTMENASERNEFESVCDQKIENAILNYNNYNNAYINNNKSILEIKDDTIKAILQETSNLENLPKDKYPLMNYFYAANYPNYEKFYEQFNSIKNCIKQYPVISNYLNAIQNEENIKFLESFHLINPFVLYMLDKYKNKISRKEAEQILIKDELEKDEDMKILFNNFKKGWEKIYKNLSNYDCHGRLPPKNITEEDCIAYCLNDNLVDNYGKYIATTYKDYITYQNEFLKPLVNNDPYHEYLYPYSKQLEKAIIVQKANRNEIVSLDIKNDLFDSFVDIIYAFSFRNCIQPNGKVSYLNYKENKFDFYSIEVELSKILLPEKKIFLNEQHQEFITYAFEEFNQNETLILDFKEKIKVNLLSNEEKANLFNLTKKIDYKLILFNLQSLFLYFIHRRNITGNELLIDELNVLPKNIVKLDNEFIDIFQHHQFNFELNKLVDCYEFIEQINYDKILKNVSSKALENLDDQQIEEIEKYFSKENHLITRNDLGMAVRKFISRFLISDHLNYFDWNIFDLLRYKNELWNDHIISEENSEQFNQEIDQLENINVRIKQSIDFYEKLKLRESNDDSKRKIIIKRKGKERIDI